MMFKRNGLSERTGSSYFIVFVLEFLALMRTTYNVRGTYGALDVCLNLNKLIFFKKRDPSASVFLIMLQEISLFPPDQQNV